MFVPTLSRRAFRPRLCRLWRLECALMWIAVCGGALAGEAPQSGREATPDWIRGSGKNLQMLLSGELERVDGQRVDGAKVSIAIKYNSKTFVVLKPEVEDGEFQVWLPIGKYEWYSVVVEAMCADGARSSKTIMRQQLRQLVKNGLKMQAVVPSEKVQFRLDHDGKPIPQAKVRVELENGYVLRCTSDENGIVEVKLIAGETISRVAAWSHEKLIGGMSPSPAWRDAKSLQLSMRPCRNYIIEVHDEDGQPVVGAKLKAHTYSEDRDFFPAPEDFELVTNEQGIAILPWFPKLEGARAFVDILDEGLHVAKRDPGENVYKIVSKRSTKRHAITGQISGANEFVGGFTIKLGSFQHEQEGRLDYAYAFSNPDGSFSASVLPDATYAIFLEDDQWVAKSVDLIPYESDTGRENCPVLFVEEGVPVRISLSQGSEERPIPFTFVNINSSHSFTWMEDGRSRSGSLGRNANDFTNRLGVIDMVAPEGNLEVSVYLSDWRGNKEIEVKRGQANEVRIHRKIDEAVTVSGRVLAWQGNGDQVANLQVHLKAIDGESGDEFKVKTDEEGRFEVQTTAAKLGAIVFTDDKKFAGSLAIKDLDTKAEIQLYPTKSYSGQIVDPDGRPVANHEVWASIKVMDVRKFGTPYPTVFYTRITKQTDAEGKYRLDGLPCKAEVLLGTDTLEYNRNQFRSIDEVYYLPSDDNRSSIKTIGDTASNSPPRTIAQQFSEKLRDCHLNNFHLMAILYDSSNKSESEFVNRHLMNYAKQKAVSTFIQMKVDDGELDKLENEEFSTSQNWAIQSGVTAIAYNGKGAELGRVELEPDDEESAGLAFRFIEDLQPSKQDALNEWEKASARAKKEGKLVWIRTGSRYCGPCFRLSRWLDDHRNVLEKDFVLVKVDARDANGAQVSEILSAGRSVGVPFHAIFDPNKKRITDSYGPIGNIGFMSGLESKRHFKEMLDLACTRISNEEIEALLDSIED